MIGESKFEFTLDGVLTDEQVITVCSSTYYASDIQRIIGLLQTKWPTLAKAKIVGTDKYFYNDVMMRCIASATVRMKTAFLKAFQANDCLDVLTFPNCWEIVDNEVSLNHYRCFDMPHPQVLFSPTDVLRLVEVSEYEWQVLCPNEESPPLETRPLTELSIQTTAPFTLSINGTVSDKVLFDLFGSEVTETIVGVAELWNLNPELAMTHLINPIINRSPELRFGPRCIYILNFAVYFNHRDAVNALYRHCFSEDWFTVCTIRNSYVLDHCKHTPSLPDEIDACAGVKM